VNAIADKTGSSRQQQPVTRNRNAAYSQQYADKKDKLNSQLTQLVRLLGLNVEGDNDEHNRQAVLHWITQLGDVNPLE
jgi:hypothetical protein